MGLALCLYKQSSTVELVLGWCSTEEGGCCLQGIIPLAIVHRCLCNEHNGLRGQQALYTVAKAGSSSPSNANRACNTLGNGLSSLINAWVSVQLRSNLAV